MKRWNLLFILFTICMAGFAQKPKIKWGDEFKLTRGSTDLEVVCSDNTGVYLQEGHLALKTYFVIGGSVRSSATLVKLDKNLNELYRYNFNKELRGMEFIQFFVLQDKLFMFASDYVKKEKTLTIYGAEIDKKTGAMKGDWMSILSIQKDEKQDDIKYKLTPNADSTSMVLVSNVLGSERNEYRVQEFNNSLKPVSKAVYLRNEFDSKTYQLEDLLYTAKKKIILVGRVYEYREGKKKKEKFLDFANYSIRLYDEAGKQQTEINTQINGKWITSTKLVQQKDKDLVLAAFYSNSKKDRTIDGMLVQRIDPVTGQVISTSEKAISNALLSAEAAEDDDDEKETRAEKKEREALAKIKDEGEGFSKFMQFRNIFYTADNGVVLLAEKFNHYIHTSTSYSSGSGGSMGRYSTKEYAVYECGDLLMCKIDAGGNIGWLQVLPKFQREMILVAQSSGLTASWGYFMLDNRPFYAGFGAIQAKNTIWVLFNDNPKNAVVTQPGQTPRLTARFGSSDCFAVAIDEATGKFTRKMMFSNSDVPTSMPRLGSVIDAGMYIVGKDDRFLGKSKVAVAKITLD